MITRLMWADCEKLMKFIGKGIALTVVVSTPFEIKLSAKGAAMEVTRIDPNEGIIETYKEVIRRRIYK